MTEQQQQHQQPEKPSERRLGRDEEQETLYAPASYPDPDPDDEGRWAVVGDGDGLIWTDDAESAGVTWVRFTPQVAALWHHFMVARSAGTPAGVAYQLAFNRGGVGQEEQGPLLGVESAFDGLMHPER